MIQGLQVKKTTQLDQALMDLETTPQQFYLTGSWSFGGSRPDSDYDFFTQDTQSIRTILDQLGYYKLSSYSYEGMPVDDNCAVVFRKDVMGDQGAEVRYQFYTHIDIQLQRDVQKKIKAQEILKKSGIFLFLKKEKYLIHKIWELVYDAMK